VLKVENDLDGHQAMKVPKPTIGARAVREHRFICFSLTFNKI
jgi:hypothetical protein